MKRSDIQYDAYIQPMRGKVKNCHMKVGLPLPETFEFEGGTYWFAYLEVSRGYIVFNEAKP